MSFSEKYQENMKKLQTLFHQGKSFICSVSKSKLHNCVFHGSKEEIIDILNNSYSILNQEDENYKTPLDYACERGDIEIIKLLVSYGARIGLSFYQAKTEQDFLHIMNLLIESQYDINKIDQLGFAPLHYASGNGFNKVAKLLLDYQAEINAPDINGNTPLSIVVANPKTCLTRGTC